MNTSSSAWPLPMDTYTCPSMQNRIKTNAVGIHPERLPTTRPPPSLMLHSVYMCQDPSTAITAEALMGITRASPYVPARTVAKLTPQPAAPTPTYFLYTNSSRDHMANRCPANAVPRVGKKPTTRPTTPRPRDLVRSTSRLECSPRKTTTTMTTK